MRLARGRAAAVARREVGKEFRPASPERGSLPLVDPRRFIAQLCTRFGVSLDFGRRLQPLVEMAAQANPRKQRLLLEMVERSFAEEGRRAERDRESGPVDDWKSLLLVARTLHGWEPPNWFDWSQDGRAPGSPSPRPEEA